jgi:GMP synthase (glutamine-hydrolysing)
VQGDSRTYKPILSISGDDLHDRATALTNRLSNVNRVVAGIATHVPMEQMTVQPSEISEDRLNRLRKADMIVRRLSEESGFEKEVWQFPVVLIPLGTGDRPDSVVLRPIHSVDGMTAQSILMDQGLLDTMTKEILDVPGICGIFYDLTNKPPGTIEWE